MRDPYDGGNVLYLDCGGGCANLQIIKLNRTKYTHIHINTSKIWTRSVDCINDNIMVMIL